MFIVLMSFSYTLGTVAKLAPLKYSTIVYGCLGDIIYFHQPFPMIDIIGMVIMVVAILLGPISSICKKL